MKRLLDIIISLIVVVILSPLFMLIAVLIKLDSVGPIFYLQERIGKSIKPFNIIKFRTMFVNSDKAGLLTVGKDSRITKIGRILRRFKIDELPQFLNVLKGEMSIVGPRPEVSKYVKFYTDYQKEIFLIKPGITDYASITFFDESETLANSTNPEETYIKEIMPIKLNYNLWYVRHNTIIIDFNIILSTALRVFGKKRDIVVIKRNS